MGDLVGYFIIIKTSTIADDLFYSINSIYTTKMSSFCIKPVTKRIGVYCCPTTEDFSEHCWRSHAKNKLEQILRLILAYVVPSYVASASAEGRYGGRPSKA